MKNNIILSSFFILISTVVFAQTKPDSSLSLNSKERSIILIAAYTAQGNMAKLHTSLKDGLNAGLTINEIKEMLIQLYAYTGLPRSLNALTNLMHLLEERKKKGIKDAIGKETSSVATGKTMLQTGTKNQTLLTGRKIVGGVYEFAPVIDRFIKEHLFGAIFSRDVLDWKTRELVTISALASMGGAEPQLRSHYSVGIHNGLTHDQLIQMVDVIETKVNEDQGLIARQLLQSVIDQKPYTETLLAKALIFPRGEKITNNNFVGTAWLNQLIQSDSSNTIQVGSVTFEPGARTRWHLHPAGQILLVLDGVGYYQEKGSPKRLLRKGDVVQCPPHIPHWHGAGREEKFVQVAVTNTQNGATVWLQEVSDIEYDQ